MYVTTILLTLASLSCRAFAQQYTAKACKDGQLLLNCRSGTIRISNIILGDSDCSGRNCCPRQNDCSRAPSDRYRSTVMNSCNGRTSCSMDVEIRAIGCSTWGPNNDYVNISFECQATTTTRTTTIATSASTTTLATPSPTPKTSRHPEIVVHTTLGAISVPYAEVTNRASVKQSGESTVFATEKEKEEGSKANQFETMTTSSMVKPGLGSNVETKPVHQGENEALRQGQIDASQQQDRMTIMTALIVGGVVIVTTVVSAAVVMVLKKRRIPKNEEQHYVMPETRCLPSVGEDNARNSNFYDFIPDFRESGSCAPFEKEEDAFKENDYLKPMTDDEERPYVWLP